MKQSERTEIDSLNGAILGTGRGFEATPWSTRQRSSEADEVGDGLEHASVSGCVFFGAELHD
jgi:hypothetical protein